MAAILLALAPAWALIETISEYAGAKKRRRAERKRAKRERKTAAHEAARLSRGRSRAYSKTPLRGLDANVPFLLNSSRCTNQLLTETDRH